MNKWELARYIIDGKKSVDTVLFLAENGSKVSNINIRQEVNDAKQKFYVSICVVMDKCFPRKKKTICSNLIISAIYYERDKNFAHKDDNYTAKEYASLQEIADEMIEQIRAVKELCSEFLPQELSLDFVAFDSKLFRIANGITKDIEEEVLNIKHPGRNRAIPIDIPTKEYKIFYDTEDIKKIDPKEYAAILQTGLCMEETMQHLQDGGIRINVLYGTDIWVSINFDALKEIIRMRELGLLDICDIPYVPKNKKDEKRIVEVMKKEGLLDDQT